jgi:hypothetical protein
MKTAAVDAVSPSRFDHRYIRKILDISGFSGNVSVAQYAKITKAFATLGGSWVGIVQGDTQAIHKLKTIVKYAVKKGFVGNKD